MTISIIIMLCVPKTAAFCMPRTCFYFRSNLFFATDQSFYKQPVNTNYNIGTISTAKLVHISLASVDDIFASLLLDIFFSGVNYTDASAETF